MTANKASGKIKYIQLKSGMELLARIFPDDYGDSMDTGVMILEDPLLMHVIPSHLNPVPDLATAGDQVILLTEWLPWVAEDEKIRIKVDNAVVVVSVQQDMEKYYSDTVERNRQYGQEKRKLVRRQLLNENTQPTPNVEEEGVPELNDVQKMMQDIIAKRKGSLH